MPLASASSPRRRSFYVVRKSAIQGKGAFATRFIPAGTRVAEYTGEIISAEEASERYDDAAMSRHHTFLFELDDGRCIDAGPKGSGDAKFINHSCEPNCEAIGEDDRVFIDTLTDLEAGDELLYDYRYMVEGPIDAETKALYACRCGAKTCRGSILAPVKPKKKPKKKASRSKTKTKAKTSTKTTAKKKTKKKAATRR